MTKNQLFTSTEPDPGKDFASLATDRRFAALMVYLRSQRPRANGGDAHQMIQDSGRLDQYLDFLDQINAAFIPPSEQKDIPKFAPYSNTILTNTDTNGR
jgi:hypothetical protein